MSVIPLCAPEIRGNEWRYVKDCLDSGWVSSAGSYVERFEAGIASAVGQRFAVATVNGTSALHIALLVAGVEPGDEVITSAITFIAPANSIRYAGAFPAFIDAEPDYYQMDAGKLSDFVTHGCQWMNGELRNRSTGRRVRAILPVHVLGHPVDLEAVVAIARRFDLAVIEDATEALGAEYRGTPVGSIGDAACLSFNGNKLLTTGGGGMIVTSRGDWARRARYLTTQAKDDPVEYVHGEIGYNYRLTNLQAAMGVAQLEQLEHYVDAKRAIARRYNTALADLPGITPMKEASWARSVFWMYTITVDRNSFGMSSRDLMRHLAPIAQTRPLWQPLHLSAPHQDAHCAGGAVAESLYRDALSLPCSVGLTTEDQATVIQQVRAAAVQSCRSAVA